MEGQEINDPAVADCEARFEAFLSAVADTREIWILVNAQNEFLKIFAEEEGLEYLPVWPDRKAALQYAGGDEALSPLALTLPVFLNKWVPGLTADKLEVGVWPTGDGTVWVLGPGELKDELRDLMPGF